MESDLVSIIVPVYNVKLYLERCVDSLLKQTYSNFEVLLIDDGSTDGSSTLCDTYLLVDSRIRVYHKVNGGLSDARNYGICKSQGKYISFVDSDDFVSPFFIETLMRFATPQTIVMSHVEVVADAEGTYKKAKKLKCRYFNAEKAIGLFLDNNCFVSACGKMYPRNVFEKVNFPLGMLYEDFATVYKLYCACGSLCEIKTSLYFYYRREGSITTSAFTQRNFAMFVILDEIGRFVENKNNKVLKRKFLNRKAQLYISMYFRMVKSVQTEDIVLAEKMIDKFIKENYFSIFLNRDGKMKVKAACTLFLLDRKLLLRYLGTHTGN